jgi:hypothetical protein
MSSLWKTTGFLSLERVWRISDKEVNHRPTSTTLVNELNQFYLVTPRNHAFPLDPSISVRKFSPNHRPDMRICFRFSISQKTSFQDTCNRNSLDSWHLAISIVETMLGFRLKKFGPWETFPQELYWFRPWNSQNFASYYWNNFWSSFRQFCQWLDAFDTWMSTLGTRVSELIDSLLNLVKNANLSQKRHGTNQTKEWSWNFKASLRSFYRSGIRFVWWRMKKFSLGVLRNWGNIGETSSWT